MVATGPPGRAEWLGEPNVQVVVQVRNEFRQLLVAWGLPVYMVNDAELAVGDLLTNVVDHARTTFRLSAQFQNEILRVGVDDGCTAVAPIEQSDPSTGRTPGSGLRIVSAVASQWGWAEYEMGKTIWVQF